MIELIWLSCNLENCVIANNAVVEDECTLKNCIVGPDELIKTKSAFDNQKICGNIEFVLED